MPFIKPIFSIAFLLFSFCAIAQPGNYQFNNKTFTAKLFYDGTDTLLAYGNYIEGTQIKNGCWIYFYKTGEVLREAYFLKDNKRGIWTYYDQKGNITKTEKWKEKDKLFDADLIPHYIYEIASLLYAFGKHPYSLEEAEKKVHKEYKPGK